MTIILTNCYHFVNISYVPGTLLITFCMSERLILTRVLQGSLNSALHLHTDDESEAQNG